MESHKVAGCSGAQAFSGWNNLQEGPVAVTIYELEWALKCCIHKGWHATVTLTYTCVCYHSHVLHVCDILYNHMYPVTHNRYNLRTRVNDLPHNSSHTSTHRQSPTHMHVNFNSKARLNGFIVLIASYVPIDICMASIWRKCYCRVIFSEMGSLIFLVNPHY